MGIHGLTKFIADQAPNAIKIGELKQYFGRKVAIDASMCMYQFLVSVRQEGNLLTNADGETTSHLMGFFYRTIRMLDNGIKPVYVFEGKAPDMKSGELDKRRERREQSAKDLAKAEMEENQEDIEKFSKRLVKVTPKHNEDCKQLLKFMGIPIIEAPGEAEAQCAELAMKGKVYGVGSEDMDTLAFGCPSLLRYLTFSEARKMPIKEFTLPKVLETIDLTMDSFIDLCILLGCDYCDSIKGIGPKKAIELIKKHGNLEECVKNLDSKYSVPENWPYQQARELFKNPLVVDADKCEISFKEPDEEAIVELMCKQNGFNEDRIRQGIKKILKAKNSTTQGRIDSFFTITPKATPKVNGNKEDSKAGIKRNKKNEGRPSLKRPK